MQRLELSRSRFELGLFQPNRPSLADRKSGQRSVGLPPAGHSRRVSPLARPATDSSCLHPRSTDSRRLRATPTPGLRPSSQCPPTAVEPSAHVDESVHRRRGDPRRHPVSARSSEQTKRAAAESRHRAAASTCPRTNRPYTGQNRSKTKARRPTLPATARPRCIAGTDTDSAMRSPFASGRTRSPSTIAPTRRGAPSENGPLATKLSAKR